MAGKPNLPRPPDASDSGSHDLPILRLSLGGSTMSSQNARALVLAVLAGLAALALAGPASARPCDPVSETCTGGGGGGGPTTASGTRTLTVSGHPAGATITGTGISCGADCSDAQPVSASCDPDCAW